MCVNYSMHFSMTVSLAQGSVLSVQYPVLYTPLYYNCQYVFSLMSEKLFNFDMNCSLFLIFILIVAGCNAWSFGWNLFTSNRLTFVYLSVVAACMKQTFKCVALFALTGCAEETSASEHQRQTLERPDEQTDATNRTRRYVSHLHHDMVHYETWLTWI